MTKTERSRGGGGEAVRGRRRGLIPMRKSRRSDTEDEGEEIKTRADAARLVGVRARVHPQKEHTSNWRHEVPRAGHQWVGVPT